MSEKSAGKFRPLLQQPQRAGFKTMEPTGRQMAQYLSIDLIKQDHQQ
jgi:hypothetical protein